MRPIPSVNRLKRSMIEIITLCAGKLKFIICSDLFFHEWNNVEDWGTDRLIRLLCLKYANPFGIFPTEQKEVRDEFS